MDGKRLAQGLLNATGDDLRLVYALVMETKMLDLLVAKSKDILNSDLNHFEIKLQEEIVRLRDYTDEELQLKLFLYLLEQLEIQGAYFNLPAEIDFACEQVVQRTHMLQLDQDKTYRKFTEVKGDDYDASSLLVLYQMQKIFETLDESRTEISEAETDKLADQIDAYIQSLPAEKQQQIKEKLHIDELTNNTVKQLIATQGTAIVMAIIVEVAGFAAFTTLTSALATTFGFFGVTLPFGAYLFATSAMSILAGPIGLALFAVGGGYLINWQNKKVRKTLLPIGVVQLLLPAMLEEEPVQYNDFIDLWNRLLARHTEYEQELANIELKLSKQREEKREFERKLTEVKQLTKNTKVSCQLGLKEIEGKINSIEEKDKSAHFHQLTARMEVILSQVALLHAERALNKETVGFWNKLKGVVANTSISSQVKKLENEILVVNSERTIEVVKMKPSHLEAICEQVQAGWTQLEKCKEEQEWLQVRISEEAEEVRRLERAEKFARSDLKEFHKVWYGFSHIE